MVRAAYAGLGRLAMFWLLPDGTKTTDRTERAAV